MSPGCGALAVLGMNPRAAVYQLNSPELVPRLAGPFACCVRVGSCLLPHRGPLQGPSEGGKARAHRGAAQMLAQPESTSFKESSPLSEPSEGRRSFLTAS